MEDDNMRKEYDFSKATKNPDIKTCKKINGKNIDLVFKKETHGAEGVPKEMWVPVHHYDIVLHGTDTVVGEINARFGHNEFLYYGGNVGYTVNDEYRGKGFAVEALQLLKQVFLQKGMDKIYITQNLENIASKRVCEKVGARFIETVELPPDNDMRIKRGETHKNIWELKWE